MKKSLVEALERGRVFSLEHPDTVVWVMDARRQHAVISSVNWIVKQRLFEGWRIEAAFKNGEKISGKEATPWT